MPACYFTRACAFRTRYVASRQQAASRSSEGGDDFRGKKKGRRRRLLPMSSIRYISEQWANRARHFEVARDDARPSFRSRRKSPAPAPSATLLSQAAIPRPPHQLRPAPIRLITFIRGPCSPRTSPPITAHPRSTMLDTFCQFSPDSKHWSPTIISLSSMSASRHTQFQRARFCSPGCHSRGMAKA